MIVTKKALPRRTFLRGMGTVLALPLLDAMAPALAGAGTVGGPPLPAFQAVVVGFHQTFTYESLRLGATAVRRGAELIGTNDDATYPTPIGPIPGGGAILAAVATGSGVSATVAGKP